MKKKILVVDDDHDIVQIVTTILIHNGFHVKAHTNGLNLPLIVKDYDPDLILLDIRLPGGKLGTELCKELKKMYSIPVILFSAELHIASEECDADDFLRKPFDMKNLVDIVNSHLKIVNEYSPVP